MSEHSKSFQLPSIVWVLLFVAGLIGFIGAIIGIFFALATIPGVASAVMLIAGAFAVWGGGSVAPANDTRIDNLVRALGVTFFALMGMAIDQSGNYVYNYPLRYLCPEGTEMSRGVNVTNPLPGRTDITQDFACYNLDGDRLTSISMWNIIGLRFFEYVLIAYLLIWVRDLAGMVKKNHIA